MLERVGCLAAGATPATPLIAARGLGFAAGGRRLIADVDLAIAPGRRTVVMGANGAGKSLLLRLLHGLLTPDAGQVLWQGHALDAAARRRQAMVFQRPVMLRRSVQANLGFALRVQGLGRAERRAREREALARGPDMLFLDEPTVSLDPASALAIETLLDEAHGAGVGIVMVTHDRAQARRIGDDVLFLHAGRVVETGPVAQVLDTPRSEPAQAWMEGRIFVGDTLLPDS